MIPKSGYRFSDKIMLNQERGDSVMTRLVALSLALLAALSAAAWSAPYPTRPVEVVVPYGAGGSTDLVARTLAQQLQARLNQTMVVINKPGGAGTIAVMSVMRAQP